jgi:hypothetical protein
MPKGSGGSDPFPNLVDGLLEKDPEAAMDFVSSVSHAPKYYNQVSRFTSKLAAQDPGAAATWASQINASGTRSYALSTAVSAWIELPRSKLRGIGSVDC